MSGEAGSVFGVTLVEASKAYHLEAKPQPQHQMAIWKLSVCKQALCHDFGTYLALK